MHSCPAPQFTVRFAFALVSSTTAVRNRTSTFSLLTSSKLARRYYRGDFIGSEPCRRAGRLKSKAEMNDYDCVQRAERWAGHGTENSPCRNDKTRGASHADDDPLGVTR